MSFCYPSGVYDENIEKMVKDAGYDIAVSTQKGWNSLKDHRFTLRRIGIHQDMTSTPAMFACKIAGTF
jgi:peptidoglycan/xylan/chitin deacetylase (PgdA/CDA1 family)